MLRAVILVSLCFLSVYASPHKDCGSVDGKLTDVQITGCPDSASICDLKKGTNATINILFTTLTAAKQVNVVIHGVIGGIPIPFPAPQPDACQKSGLTCPLSANTAYTYQLSMPILSSYPTVRLTIKFELVNKDSSKDLVCATVPAELVN